jgi:hypothetical protein
MRASNRNLLVLTGKFKMNQREFEHQLELLNDLLHHVENLDAFCVATELLDINRNKVVQDFRKMHAAVNRAELKPFVFIHYKN